MLIDAWLVYWDQINGFNVIKSNCDLFREVSPFWYQFAGNPTTKKFPGAEDVKIINYAHAQNIKIIPTIRDNADSTQSKVIDNPSLRKQHIENIVNLTVAMNYDGIDIDYENFDASDRDDFSTFMSELSLALHANNKLLNVCVAAKTSEPDPGGSTRSQDWTALSSCCDSIRVMCYDYHWRKSAAGPVAPKPWVERVIKFARSSIPKEKMVLGLPSYGYDWPKDEAGASITWTSSIKTALKHNAAIQWNETFESPWFNYIEGGIVHEVWFENAASLNSKLELAKKYDINGVCIWRLGSEDPEIWKAIRNRT
jgi:spore germination protein